MPKREFRRFAAVLARRSVFFGGRRQEPRRLPAIFSTCTLPKDTTTPTAGAGQKRAGPPTNHGVPQAIPPLCWPPKLANHF